MSMHISTRKVTDIQPSRPYRARRAVSGAEQDGRRKVLVHLSAEDNYAIPHVVAVLDMSPEEALDFAAALRDAAISTIEAKP